MSCNNNTPMLPIHPKTTCGNDIRIEPMDIMLGEGKYYENGKYRGDILSIDGRKFKIKRVSDNKYMNGQIVNMEIIN